MLKRVQGDWTLLPYARFQKATVLFSDGSWQFIIWCPSKVVSSQKRVKKELTLGVRGEKVDCNWPFTPIWRWVKDSAKSSKTLQSQNVLASAIVCLWEILKKFTVGNITGNCS